MTTVILNPTIDGTVTRGVGSEDWSTIHNHTNGNSAGSTSANSEVRITADDVEDMWSGITRAALTFDTSTIPEDAAISSAVLSIYGMAKLRAGITSGGLGVYSFSPYGDDDVRQVDYNKFGAINFANTILYGIFSTSAYNDFTLNGNGIAYINRGGNTRFGIRESVYDGPNSEPIWVSPGGLDCDIFFQWEAEDNNGNKPKLVVTYGDATILEDRVTGEIIRVGPGHYSDELRLGGLTTNWNFLDWTAKPLPTIPTDEGWLGPYYEITEEGMRWYWLLPDGSKKYIFNIE